MVMKTTLEGIFPLKRIFAVSQEHLIMTEGLRMTAKDCKSAEDGEICRDEKSSTWELWPFFLLHLSSGLSGKLSFLSFSF